MKQNSTFYKLGSTLVMLLISVAVFAQGVTTSSIRGTVTDTEGETMIGATVLAVHQPSGTSYGTITDEEGNYRISGMRVGGPYKINVSYTGFGEIELDNVFLRLGEAQKRNFTMEEAALELTTITVSALAGIPGQNAGASTQITEDEINAMPTLDRNLEDFVRLTPQADVDNTEGITIAGQNNRFNAIYIDGVVNNDVFGLAGSGTNGGQTGIAPFSIDIIDQFQVVISPYDVSLGGFAGGGINAVTKSGTNKFEGTAYYFWQNQDLAGKTPGKLADRLGLADDDRTKLADFSEKLYGVSLGGPIVKDKVFFFANVEIQDDETPAPFDFGTYRGDASLNDLENLRSVLMESYGYDPGGFLDKADKLEGLKLFGKLDFNISEDHKLTLRHQYTKAELTDAESSFGGEINYANNGEFFPSTTNSFAAELNSSFGNKFSNNLIIGFTTVNDDRDPIGDNFPWVRIADGGGDIYFGSEEFSTANQLTQDIITLTNNFKWYNGNHTFTFGTHNEFYSIYNLFIRQNFGSYDFASLDDFLNGEPAFNYDRSYSLVDNVTGDGSAAAAEFDALQIGFYAQDQIQVNEKLTVTAGIRLDIPVITTEPVENREFNAQTLPMLEQHYDMEGAESGKMPEGQLMWSPRVGFNYDVQGNTKTIVRGGIGVFTSRIPFVWPGGSYTNNGLTVGGLDEGDIAGDVLFNPDWDNQPTNPNFTVPSGQIDLFAKDFRYPQVLRGNLALDHVLPGGIQASLEGIYTKTLNNVLYTSVNSDPTVDFNWTNGGDNRPVYVGNSIDPTYTAVYLGTNTSDGYAYNLSLSLSKKFDFGLNAFLAYNYGDSEAVNEGTSSQNSSQWRGQIHIDGRNFPVLGRSDYSSGHRIVSALSYQLDWNKEKNATTTFSLFLNAQSGQAYSYVYGSFSASNINNERGSTSRNRSLIYVPASMSDINLVETDGMSPAEQWALLDEFISEDDHLSERRGQYAEKNGARTPFETIIDFKLMQDVALNVGGNNHKLQFSLDIFNFANFLNKDWGVDYNEFLSDFNNYNLIDFEGYDADGTTPQFSYTDDRLGKERYDIENFAGRWRMRLGVRYIFN